ncbi:DUF3224 domain-containing protein [Actinomadura craniellae]|nr:DUF3224 domain-containing protein [Actinomadura craniellae]
MSEKASGTFDIDVWDSKDPYDDRDGVTLTPVQVEKTFKGDLVGTSVAHLQTVTTPAGPVAYVGVERVEGTLNGRKGSFVLRHQAADGPEGPWLTWVIVPTSGTGELAGIRGEGQIQVGPDGAHSFTLDYDLA